MWASHHYETSSKKVQDREPMKMPFTPKITITLVIIMKHLLRRCKIGSPQKHHLRQKLQLHTHTHTHTYIYIYGFKLFSLLFYLFILISFGYTHEFILFFFNSLFIYFYLSSSWWFIYIRHFVFYASLTHLE